MRRANSILTIFIMILFVIHLVWGSLELSGMTAGGNPVFSALSYLLVVFVILHVLIAVKLTADTIIACRKAKVSYWKENRLFWVRRISGVALMIFMAAHVVILTGEQTGSGYRLKLFDAGRLATQILMTLSLAVHLLTNIRPLKIGLGLEDKGNLKTDVLLVLSALLLLAGIAFVIYFLRWQVV